MLEQQKANVATFISHPATLTNFCIIFRNGSLLISSPLNPFGKALISSKLFTQIGMSRESGFSYESLVDDILTWSA